MLRGDMKFSAPLLALCALCACLPQSEGRSAPAEAPEAALLTGSQDTRNRLIASYSAVPDPFHWFSFYSLPRTTAAARADGWADADEAPVVSQNRTVSYWCRPRDYTLCVVFDAMGAVAGLQVSVAVHDFEDSFGSARYPIDMESLWRRRTVLGTEVFSATAMFVPMAVLGEGGRQGFGDADDTLLDTLYLENGNAFWAMPGNARDAADVGYTKQGCVQGMGRHYFYNMGPSMACEEHRPFFLLFDDVTGDLHGFGVTLYGKASRAWTNRWWLEAPGRGLVSKMAPGAPQCFLDWSEQKGLVTLHVYFRPRPWEAKCSEY